MADDPGPSYSAASITGEGREREKAGVVELINWKPEERLRMRGRQLKQQAVANQPIANHYWLVVYRTMDRVGVVKKSHSPVRLGPRA